MKTTKTKPKQNLTHQPSQTRFHKPTKNKVFFVISGLPQAKWVCTVRNSLGKDVIVSNIYTIKLTRNDTSEWVKFRILDHPGAIALRELQEAQSQLVGHQAVRGLMLGEYTAAQSAAQELGHKSSVWFRPQMMLQENAKNIPGFWEKVNFLPLKFKKQSFFN